MPTFITTLNFTEQGSANIKETCKRAEAFKRDAKKMGIKVGDIYWTLGAIDGVIVFDAPDEETATAAMLHLGSQGNVQTHTARAYKAPAMKEILSKLS